MAQEPAALIVFAQLPPDLNVRIFNHLTPNEIACCVRPINRSSAAHYRERQHRTVHIRQPFPRWAFTQHWSHPDSYRALTLAQRRRLLCLTAASGDLEHLQVVAENVGCVLTEEIFTAAAAAGQLETCVWLRQRGCPMAQKGPDSPLIAAASSGHRAMCDWLLANGCCWDSAAVLAAGRNGHVPLLEWLQQCVPPGEMAAKPRALLMAITEGCDLATLQRFALQVPLPGEGWAQDRFAWNFILPAAANSPTPDWKAKVMWVKQQVGLHGTVVEPILCWMRMIERLPELRALGLECQVDRLPYAAHTAAETGNVSVLRVMLTGGFQVDASTVYHAAQSGQLEVMQLLHVWGLLAVTRLPIYDSMRFGHLHVLRWLAELPGLSLRDMILAQADFAASSGNMDLLTWLVEQGWRQRCVSLRDVAVSGNQEAAEWLVQNCETKMDPSEAYMAALSNGDLAMLRCLRRLQIPWGSVPLLTFAITSGCDLAVLSWLLEQDYPVDWSEAVTAAVRREGDSRRVLAWIWGQQAPVPKEVEVERRKLGQGQDEDEEQQEQQGQEGQEEAAVKERGTDSKHQGGPEGNVGEAAGAQPQRRRGWLPGGLQQKPKRRMKCEEEEEEEEEDGEQEGEHGQRGGTEKKLQRQGRESTDQGAKEAVGQQQQQQQEVRHEVEHQCSSRHD